MSGDAAPRYDEHAAWYHDWIFAPADDLVARSLLGLVGAVRGERVLDLACGEGRIARALAGQGNEVVGVDLSAGLLDIARAEGDARITYVHGDVCATDWWDGAPFDGVVASMSLMDIDDLAGAVATAAATVRAGGWFAWSIIHPGFPGVGEIRPSWPDGGYFDERWWNTGGAGVRGRVGVNHRTLSTYLNGVGAAGFVLEATDEPRWSPGPGLPDMPFFLVTRWRRL
ncbi:MAG TPA: class I SAM-dependent methyltransferase [Acidimicrobiales bacterium]|jgi:SAM-dependent methyltransferase